MLSNAQRFEIHGVNLVRVERKIFQATKNKQTLFSFSLHRISSHYCLFFLKSWDLRVQPLLFRDDLQSSRPNVFKIAKDATRDTYEVIF